MVRPGRPTTTASSGTMVPAGRTVPSPRKHLRPTRTPGMRIEPFPISLKSPTEAPIRRQRWPKTAFCPTATGKAEVPIATEFSRSAEEAPISTAPAGDRTTAPCAMRPPGPMRKRPSTTAEGATCTSEGAGSRLRLMRSRRYNSSGRCVEADRREFARPPAGDSRGETTGLLAQLGNGGRLPQVATPHRAEREKPPTRGAHERAVAVGGETPAEAAGAGKPGGGQGRHGGPSRPVAPRFPAPAG